MKLTRLEFRDRFTTDEKRAIYNAASSSVDLKIYLDELSMAEFVDTESPNTISGVQALEVYGIIAAGRAAQILGDAPSQSQFGFTVGQYVQMTDPEFVKLFPGIHQVLGFGNHSVVLAVGEFDITFVGAA